MHLKISIHNTINNNNNKNERKETKKKGVDAK